MKEVADWLRPLHRSLGPPKDPFRDNLQENTIARAIGGPSADLSRKPTANPGERARSPALLVGAWRAQKRTAY